MCTRDAVSITRRSLVSVWRRDFPYRLCFPYLRFTTRGRGQPAQCSGETMAEVSDQELATSTSKSKSRIEKVSTEDVCTDSTDHIAVKIICLGDSAVGKSK